MKLIFTKSIITICVMFVLLACGNKTNPTTTFKNDKVVKIIKTKAYSAKVEFDKFVIDKPAYHMGYDQTVGMDFSFNTKHIDKYNNIIYQEDFDLNEKSEEKIIRKITYEYFSPQEGKLTSKKIEGERYGEYSKIEYIRNDKGQLKEKRELSKGVLNKKTVFSYNEDGHRIKEEVYKENGLYEIQIFVYDLLSLTKGKLIKLIHEVYGEDNYKEEFDYERNNDNQITKSRRRYFEKGKLLSDQTTVFSDYVGNISTKEITEGYDPPTRYSDGTVYPSESYRRTIVISLNLNGDISLYKQEIKKLEEHEIDRLLKGLGNGLYKFEYTYNFRKDWTQLIFSNIHGINKSDFIINREIKYLD